jgi:hypothetical protein
LRPRRLGRIGAGFARVVLGSRTGGAIALVSLLFTGLYLKFGLLINDSATVANTLVAVADGHLHVDEVVVGRFPPTTPGMSIVDGRLYGRNYGLVFLSLPFYALYAGLDAVVDLRLALLGGWCLGLAALFLFVDDRVHADGKLAIGGAVLSLLVFAANVPGSTDLPRGKLYVLALQSTTMVATALTAVFVYRLVASLRDERAGVLAGLATVLATPVPFWASFPKRHALMAGILVVALFVYHRSVERRASDPTRALLLRATTYGLVGFTAWIHAGETAFLLVALGAYDATAGHGFDLDLRTLATLGGATFVSMLPFFALNTVVSGNPLVPPILNPSYGTALGSAISGNTASVMQAITEPLVDPIPNPGGARSAGGAVTPDGSPGSAPAGPVATVAAPFDELVTRGGSSLAALTQPKRLFVVFVDSREVTVGGESLWEGGVNLAVVEAAPIFAAALATVRPLVSRLRRSIAERELGGHAPAVGLAVAWMLAYVLLYVHELPLGVMYTMRYLVPAMPLLLVIVFRTEALGPVFREWKVAGGSYAATVLVGGQLFLIGLWYFDVGRGQAYQAHGAVNLVAAACLGGWSLLSGRRKRRHARLGAALFGVAAGVTTVFLLAAGAVYLGPTGKLLLPVVDGFTDALRLFD